MVTDEMVEKAARAICEAAEDDWDWSVFYIVDANDTAESAQNLYREMARAALEAALSAAEPIRWMWEERRFAESDIWDDMYDDEPPAPHKHVRNIRPLYAAPSAPSVAVKAKPDGYLTPTMPGESWHSWKSCAISEPGARPFYFSPAMANTEWKELDDAFSNFINCYGDTFKPKRNHEKETERNVKALSKAFDAARSALSGSRQSAQAVVVKALRWDEFSTELKRHFQSNTILGQYQIAYLGEFECWQLYSPQKSSTWKENFSRHKSSDEAKAAAQADFETRIRSALSAQVQDVAGWQPIETAPKDKTPIIIAVPTKDRDDWIVGEGYFDPDHYEGGDWWWANLGYGDYHAGPISECNHWPPELWQPLPVPAAAPAKQES